MSVVPEYENSREVDQNKGFTSNGYPSGMNRDGLRDQLLSSSTYRDAYNIFSQDSKYGQQYISRLNAIVESAQSADRTMFDDWNWSNRADDKDQATFNEAILAIQNLVADYYEFLNTLPKEQVAQANEAGYNMAVTGDGLQSSNMASQPMQGFQSNQLPSTQGYDFVTGAIGNAVNIISSITGVVNSVSTCFSAFSNARLSKRAQTLDQNKFLSSIWKTLFDSGFDVGGESFKSFDDLFSFFKGSNSDFATQTKLNDVLKKFFASEVDIAPLEYYFKDKKSGGLLTDIPGAIGDALKSRYPDKSPQEILEIIASYEIQSSLLKKVYDNAKSKYDVDYAKALDGTDAGNAVDAENDAKDADNRYKELVAQLQKAHLLELAEKYKNATDVADKFAILQIINGMDIDDAVYAELVPALGSAFGSKVIVDGTASLTEFLEKASRYFIKKPKSR